MHNAPATKLGRDMSLQSMGLGRVELPTSRLSGVRSNHLSYRPRLSGTTCERNRERMETQFWLCYSGPRTGINGAAGYCR